MARYLTAEECYGNWNFTHEWKGTDGEWHPCHLYDKESLLQNGISIFTQTGAVVEVDMSNVRKMSKEQYLNTSDYGINATGEYFEIAGFHKDLEDDLNIWEMA